ncbi:unnamed protein product [Scytosiphon promiscuus]
MAHLLLVMRQVSLAALLWAISCHHALGFMSPFISLRPVVRESCSAKAPSAARRMPLSMSASPPKDQKEVVVIGGGWAGFGAASHLASAGVKVTLLEAQPSAGGLAAGWETAKGNR